MSKVQSPKLEVRSSELQVEEIHVEKLPGRMVWRASTPDGRFQTQLNFSHKREAAWNCARIVFGHPHFDLTVDTKTGHYTATERPRESEISNSKSQIAAGGGGGTRPSPTAFGDWTGD